MTLKLIDGDRVGAVSFSPFRDNYTGQRQEVKEVIRAAESLQAVDAGEPEFVPESTISEHGAEDFTEASPREKRDYLKRRLPTVGVFAQDSD